MRAFRLLTEPEIECRIAEINRQGTGLTLLLYKTARTDAALLDETYGADHWQNDFKMLDGKLYGGIGIKFNDEWIWRWDCGTESNMEAEKGQASDAFKRAGFKWGLGAELYTAPRIWIPRSKCEIKEYNGKYRCYDTFEVSQIEYSSNGSIVALQIQNTTQHITAFDMEDKKSTNDTGKTSDDREDVKSTDNTGKSTEHGLQAASPEGQNLYYCKHCGKVIMPYADANGRKIGAERHVEASKDKFGEVLCLDCIRRVTHENAS